MNEELKEWQELFWKNFGPRELLRFGCVLIIMQIIGIALSFALKNFGIALISIVLTFSILWLAPYWQPAYTIFRQIIGNRDIPSTLPQSQGKWWHYIPIAIKVIMLLAIFRLGLQLLFQ